MARLRISISSDGLRAEANATSGPALLRAQLDAELKQAGVVFGLDLAAIDAFATRLADPAYVGKQVLANGTAAQPGVDGHTNPAFALGQTVGQLCSDGHVDYHERQLLQPVAPQTTIATVLPPTAGTPGQDVRGRTVPAKPGAPAKLRLGPGVQLQEDRIVATRGGVLLADDKGLDVVSLYSHRGDIDLKSGNLHSEGSLEVAGDVSVGFIAEAVGDVLVHGSVQSAKVQAGGSVHIDQGVLGGESLVRAGGDIRCRHATAAQLQAGSTVHIGDQLGHCHVRADRIELLQGRGQAFGGELHALSSIDLLRAGTTEGAATQLAVADLLDERAELTQRTTEAARAGRLAQGAAAGGRFSKGKSTRIAVRAEDRSEAERLRLLARQRELLAQASITVRDTLHPGVQVQFGKLILRIDKPRGAVRFRYDPTTHSILEEEVT